MGEREYPFSMPLRVNCEGRGVSSASRKLELTSNSKAVLASTPESSYSGGKTNWRELGGGAMNTGALSKGL